MASDLGVRVADLLSSAELRAKIDLQRYVTERTGLPTLRDILSELARPGTRSARRGPDFRVRRRAFDRRPARGHGTAGIVTNVRRFRRLCRYRRQAGRAGARFRAVGPLRRVAFRRGEAPSAGPRARRVGRPAPGTHRPVDAGIGRLRPFLRVAAVLTIRPKAFTLRKFFGRIRRWPDSRYASRVSWPDGLPPAGRSRSGAGNLGSRRNVFLSRPR